MVLWIIREFLFSDLNLGKFLDLVEFQSWKVNFRTEVCLRTADPQITMRWIKQVDIAKSIDEFMTSPDFDMLDAMIVSALKKASQHADTLPKESKCRRAAF